MNFTFKKYLLKSTDATYCQEIEVIQPLWSGYGKIVRYQLEDSEFDTIVVKHIAPKGNNEHPRGWNTNISHQRKIKSYQVETEWYKNWSPLCTANCKVPSFIGSYSREEEQWMILEDLNKDFPLRKHILDLEEIKVCLKWLGNFHATFMNKTPKALWEIGTYWHLATRPDEFEKIEHAELKEKAHKIDEKLNNCTYQTIVHGDAKLANFCFSSDGKNVAAVDFQYVGGGCGMKDVAYFLGSCLSGKELELFEEELLNYYFSKLKQAIEATKAAVHFSALEKEWRPMYPLACADFTRFLLGWMPTHQKINTYQLKILKSVLIAI